MDIANLNTMKAADEGAWLELKHPATGEKLGASIKLAGADSAIFRNKKREISNRRINAKSPATIEQIESEGLELLASCVIDWGKLQINGATPTDAKAVFSEYAWIKEQADEFIGERANFLASPAKG